MATFTTTNLHSLLTKNYFNRNKKRESKDEGKKHAHTMGMS